MSFRHKAKEHFFVTLNSRINMKKFILSVVAVAAFASYNVYRSNNNETEGMSDTMLANVEALAAGENGSISDCEHYCKLKPGYTCIILFGDGIQGITCPGYGKKDQ